MEVEEILFDVSDALRIPVLVLALAGLAYVLFELGGLVAELFRRRGRSRVRLDQAIISAGSALKAGDSGRAYLELGKVATSRSMRGVLGSVVEHRSAENGADRIAKDLAEFDYASVRRLERTRILVRVGPALGLMGTLIPLAPALAGLAAGDVETLSDNLRVAFSVTVLGLLVGSIAFAISLVRDRLYGQDYSDLEYVATALAPGRSLPTQTLASQTQPTPPAMPAPTAAQPAVAPAATPAAPNPGLRGDPCAGSSHARHAAHPAAVPASTSKSRHVKVSPRARSHEDRGGDPLDGLVNLFDLGIVLAVAFLLAALSSVDLEEVFTDQEALEAARAVTASEGEVVNEVELAPGERVVGQGEEIGTVYELSDGRTVIVRPEGSEPVPGEGAPVPEDPSTTTPDETTPPDETIAPETTTPETTPDTTEDPSTGFFGAD